MVVTWRAFLRHCVTARRGTRRRWRRGPRTRGPRATPRVAQLVDGVHGQAGRPVTDLIAEVVELVPTHWAVPGTMFGMVQTAGLMFPRAGMAW